MVLSLHMGKCVLCFALIKGFVLESGSMAIFMESWQVLSLNNGWLFFPFLTQANKPHVLSWIICAWAHSYQGSVRDTCCYMGRYDVNRRFWFFEWCVCEIIGRLFQHTESHPTTNKLTQSKWVVVGTLKLVCFGWLIAFSNWDQRPIILAIGFTPFHGYCLGHHEFFGASQWIHGFFLGFEILSPNK